MKPEHNKNTAANLGPSECTWFPDSIAKQFNVLFVHMCVKYKESLK